MKESDQQKASVERLGEFIRQRRKSLQLSLTVAADRADLDRTYWRRLEDGEYSKPSARALGRIADVIGVSSTDLFVLAGYPIGEDLPGFGPYLRSKFHLPPKAIDELETYFAFMRAQYGIPDDEPVFPPKPRDEAVQQQREADRRAA